MKGMGFVSYRLVFTTEDKKEIVNILSLCNKVFVQESGDVKSNYCGDFTYGHYKRGVE